MEELVALTYYLYTGICLFWQFQNLKAPCTMLNEFPFATKHPKIDSNYSKKSAKTVGFCLYNKSSFPGLLTI